MSAFLPLKDTLQTNANTFQDVFEYRNCKFVKQMCAVCAKWQEFLVQHHFTVKHILLPIHYDLFFYHFLSWKSQICFKSNQIKQDKKMFSPGKLELATAPLNGPPPASPRRA